MRIITITLFWIFMLFSYSFGEIGIVLNYKLKGESLGQTGIRGKFRVLFKPKMKRLTGSIYYQEAGSLFPNLDEKDIIIDFNTRTKEYFTRESRSWLSTPLATEYALVKSRNIKVTSRKVKKGVKTIVRLTMKRKLGGKQKYIITFTYNDSRPEKVNDELKKYKKPSAADILSIFINNEKIVNEISRRSLIRKYGIPDTFSIKWQQKGKTKLNVTAHLKTKAIVLLSEDAFAPEN